MVFGNVVNPLWGNLYAFGQIFIVVNGQILKKQSGHLVTLVTLEPSIEVKLYFSGILDSVFVVLPFWIKILNSFPHTKRTILDFGDLNEKL